MQLSRLRPAFPSFVRRFRSTGATPSEMSDDGPYMSPGPPLTRKPLRFRNATSPYELPGEARPNYPKRKHPRKRTTALIEALAEEEGLRMISEGRAVFPKKIPNPQPGDIIRISYASNLENLQMKQYFSGICMSVKRRGLGSSFVLRNVVHGVAVERGFPMYSPLIQDAEVIGKRKVRSAKLYYLRDKPLRDSTIPDATKRPRN